MDDPPEVAVVEDRVIAGPAGDVPVRVYTPDAPAPRPLVAFFHGGGFVYCSLETHDNHVSPPRQRTGATVVSVDYRLAPEHAYPAAADDCLAATPLGPRPRRRARRRPGPARGRGRQRRWATSPR